MSDPKEDPEAVVGSAGVDPKWEYRERLNIHEKMTDVVKKTYDLSKSQLEAMRLKLRKMQYGS
jgi:hypothetical protein